MAATLLPNSEIVSVAFLKSLNLSSGGSFGVGTTLPEKTSSWADGFVQVSVVGGAADIDVPTRKPMVQIDCWVPSINTTKPQWGKANTIAEEIHNALYAGDTVARELELGNYQGARVQTVYPVSEPRRVPNDPAGHARYTFDVIVTWVVSHNVVPV